MVLEQPWAQKRMFWVFEKNFLQFFASVSVTKLKPFSGKTRQSLQNYLNGNLGISTFLENGFGATLNSKTNVLSAWKNLFPGFSKSFNDEVETISSESEAKR